MSNSNFKYNATNLYFYYTVTSGAQKFLRDIENSTPIKWDEEREYIKVYKNLDSSEEAKEIAIHKIVTGNVQYITTAVMKSVKYLKDDEFFMLVNDMVVDLINSINSFDESKISDGFCLWNYAQNILHLKAKTHHIYSRRKMCGDSTSFFLLSKLKTEESAIGRKLSIAEICKKLKCKKDKAIRVKAWDLEYVSFDSRAYNEGHNMEELEATFNIDNRLDSPAPSLTPLDILVKKDTKELLKSILKSLLTHKQYTVVNLRLFYGLSYELIMNKLGIDNKSVDNYICSSYKVLRKNKGIIKELLLD